MARKAWMNVYAQGWYHRVGKPTTMNMHPGDFYATEEAAKRDIDLSAPYLFTTSVDIPDTLAGVVTYGPEHGVIPLGTTRRAIEDGTMLLPQPGPRNAHPVVPTGNHAWRKPGQPNYGRQIPSFGQADSLEQADA